MCTLCWTQLTWGHLVNYQLESMKVNLNLRGEFGLNADVSSVSQRALGQRANAQNVSFPNALRRLIYLYQLQFDNQPSVSLACWRRITVSLFQAKPWTRNVSPSPCIVLSKSFRSAISLSSFSLSWLCEMWIHPIYKLTRVAFTLFSVLSRTLQKTRSSPYLFACFVFSVAFLVVVALWFRRSARYLLRTRLL